MHIQLKITLCRNLGWSLELHTAIWDFYGELAIDISHETLSLKMKGDITTIPSAWFLRHRYESSHCNWRYIYILFFYSLHWMSCVCECVVLCEWLTLRRGFLVIDSTGPLTALLARCHRSMYNLIVLPFTYKEAFYCSALYNPYHCHTRGGYCRK